MLMTMATIMMKTTIMMMIDDDDDDEDDDDDDDNDDALTCFFIKFILLLCHLKFSAFRSATSLYTFAMGLKSHLFSPLTLLFSLNSFKRLLTWIHT